MWATIQILDPSLVLSMADGSYGEGDELDTSLDNPAILAYIAEGRVKVIKKDVEPPAPPVTAESTGDRLAALEDRISALSDRVATLERIMLSSASASASKTASSSAPTEPPPDPSKKKG